MNPTTWRGRLRRAVNRILAPAGVEVARSSDRTWWTDPWTFAFGGRTYRQFWHPHNCGWPPLATERTVELALADRWLDLAPPREVVEVGAVTPYYWPGRVREVVDPTDPHPRVTHRVPVAEVDLRGRAVLAISTLEHLGTGEYGRSPGEDDPGRALARLGADSPRFLATVPVGANPAADEALFGPRAGRPSDVSLRFLVREPDGTWREADAATALSRPYGEAGLARRHPGTAAGRWANAVAVLERGGLV